MKLKKHYDVLFIGHVTREEDFFIEEDRKISRGTVPGGAAFCGSIAVRNIGYNPGVVTKLRDDDRALLKGLIDAGIDVYSYPSAETTTFKVMYNSQDINRREIFVQGSADRFREEEIPEVDAEFVHVAAVSNQEVTVDFLRYLKEERGFRLGLDLQTFVRALEGDHVIFRDWPEKKRALHYVDVLKSDDIEGEILTGHNDPVGAARVYATWGAKEVLITSMEGITVYKDGDLYNQPFTNRSVIGRTGRGDTAIAVYLARRLSHGIGESLLYSAALTSLKMENIGPFNGTTTDVEKRIQEYYTGKSTV